MVVVCLALAGIALAAYWGISSNRSPAPSALNDQRQTNSSPSQLLTRFSQAVQLRPNDPLARYNLAVALAEARKEDEALEQYRQALQLDPKLAPAYNNVAALLIARGRPGEAAASASEAVRLKPDYPEAHLNLANALFIQEQFKEAEEHYRTVLRLQPGNADAHLNLGKVLANQERLEDAVAHLREAVRLGPQQATPHQILAKVFLARKRPKEAASEFSAALALAPDWLEGLHSLAWLRAACPDPELRNGVEAVQLATRACQLTQSTNVTILQTMAAAYAEAEMILEARDFQQMACDLAKLDPWRHESAAANARLDLYARRLPCREAQIPDLALSNP